MKTMRHVLVQFVTIFVLFQCIKGTLHHFQANKKQYPAGNVEYHFKKKYHFEEHRDIFTRSDDNDIAVDKLSKQPLRARRQNIGGDPESYTFNLTSDDHQYARVVYSAEGSKVN